MKAWEHIYRDVADEAQRFFKDLDRPAQRQEAVLKEILQNNMHTRFGLQYGFQDITSIRDFQDKVPVHTYEQLSCYIDDISKGENNVLTTEEVTVFEETGGSTKGAKLIPCTESSMRAFQKALYPWLYDLLSKQPEIMHGSAYWSISPALRNKSTTPSGIHVGLSNDAEYFGLALAENILRTLAVPPIIGTISEINSWRYLTLRYLLSARELSLVSVWSPTFLLDLMTALSEHYTVILDDIRNKTLSVPLPEGISEDELSLIDIDDARVSEINAAFQGDMINTRLLWPKLNTISCWLDANAANYRDKLELLFPHVYLQGKGLLATEGVVSIPLCHENGSVLATNSGFFEFIDKENNIYLAHELKETKTYRVLLTTYSGLYRYDLGDQIIVTGYHGKTPLVKFAGRSGLVSDMCGEKLAESFVLNQLDDVKGHAMLLPCEGEQNGYLLLLEKSLYSQAEAAYMVEIIDQRLCTNPQYAYARKIGQLAPLAVLRVNQIWELYLQRQYDNGRCLGDIKPVVLSNDVLLYQYFTAGKVLSNKDVVCAH